MPELRRLQQFVAVAEELHFGRAAARLNMTQPPLSMQIRRLEEEVGGSLFLRHNRRVELTEAGRTLLVEARRTIAAAERALALARRAAQGEIGAIRVGFISTAGYSFLPALLGAFRARHPGVELTLREMTTDAQLRAFRADELDVGFVLAPVAEPDLEAAPVHAEPLVVALPVGHRLARGKAPVEVARLAGEGFIVPPPDMAPHHYESLLALAGAAGFAPRIEQVAVQMQTIVGLVAGGLGIAIVPECMRRANREGIVFRTLRPEPPKFATAVVWPAGGGSIPAARLVAMARSNS